MFRGGRHVQIKVIKIATILLMVLLSASNSIAVTSLSCNDLEKISSTPTFSAKTVCDSWECYPLTLPGTDISFPVDEGKHDPFFTYPIEWWYVNFQLIGSDTGKEYGAFVAFFKTTQLRVFSISDISSQKMYTNSKFGLILADDDKLGLTFIGCNDDIIYPPQNYQYLPIGEQPIYNQAVLDIMEEQQISIDDFTLEQSVQPLVGGGLLCYDYWHTKTNDEGDLLPFQYELSIAGRAQEEDNGIMQLNVDMHSLKQPLIVGGDGLLELGDGWSYYYSETKVETSGDITVNGVTESVTGYAWIDHQWGEFLDDDFVPVGISITYEWFAIKLDDFRELVIGDTWRRDTGEEAGPFCDGINLVNSDGSLELLEDYTITQLEFWTDELSGKTFATEWEVTELTKQIDLIITADIDNQMMHVTKDPLLLQIVNMILPAGSFWEGSCSVTGTIEGSPVSGKAYVESTHSWDDYNQESLQTLQVTSQSSTLQSNPVSQPSNI